MNLPPLYRAENIRAIEQQQGADGLMEMAGLAVAEMATELLKKTRADILVLAGPGNNGGDALVAARHLKNRFYNIHVLCTGDAGKLPTDARTAYDAWLACGGKIINEIASGMEFGLVIDGLFGIGLTRGLDARYIDLISVINVLPATKLSIDIPSGLCGDTGRVLGAAIQADHTVTFIARKPGLYTLDGTDHAGRVHLADLGVVPSSSLACGWLVDSPPAMLSPRKRNSHKGNYGSVGMLGGASGMVGAALLAGRAALLAGGGRVYCHILASDAPLVDTDFPELMLRHNQDLEENLDCIIVGPGMGRSELALTRLRAALQTASALVLDADALHMLATDHTLRNNLKERGNAVLTPHPGEAAALLDCDTAHIQADRIASALHIADLYHASVLLKGAGSIIATPEGRWFINASGNPGLSSAGMGDVLTGVVAALIAQGLSVEQATLLGVYLHGKAADDLVADGIGPLGLKASEIALEVRNLLNNMETLQN